jgi:hypothetical protein
MTSSNPAYKRRRVDLGAPAAPAPQTPPALVAFPSGAAAGLPRPLPGSLLNQPLSGSVDTEFDMGYFVTVIVGGREFRGAA